jgi:CIC family chloride channel protein
VKTPAQPSAPLTPVSATTERFQQIWHALLDLLHDRDWDQGGTLMVAGAVIGLVSGLGVVAFYGLIDASNLLLARWPEQHVPWFGQAILRVTFTAIGLWVAWFIVRRAGVPQGQNVPDVQRAVAKRGGIIPFRAVAARTLASAVTLGSGGSAGSEGPVAVLGAAVGSRLGKSLRFQPRHLKILVGCGAAAGIAGAFNAPFAGAFFALEEILGSFSVGAFSPVVIASVVGALTVSGFLGTHPAFSIPNTTDVHPVANALLYPILGVMCGLASALYSRLDVAMPAFVRRLPGPVWWRPLAGGALVGVIVLGSGGLLAGDGHLAIPHQVFGGLAWYLLIGIALAKILATVITLGTGGSGGVFTPALFIGAALGGGFGRLLETLVPGHLIHPAAWALVGMAGLVSGATRAPLTAIFIVYELTNDASFVAPLMIVSVVSYVTARRFSPYGLYDGWLAARGEHLAHGVDTAVMDQLHVRDAIDRTAPRVPPEMGVAALAELMGEARAAALAVVSDDGTLAGMVVSHDVNDALLQPVAARQVLIAEDLATAIDVLDESASLRAALAAMSASGRDALAVVAADDEGQPRYVGLLTRAAAFSAYDRALEHAV